MEVKFFPNGNTAVFDKGKQISELQMGWMECFLEFLVSKGVDVESEVYFTMPDNKCAIAYRVEGGFNWKVT